MNTPRPDRHDAGTDRQIVYIRAVPAEALPDEIRAQIGDVGPVWGVHSADGECLALAKDRRLAFVVARQNALDPVSAH